MQLVDRYGKELEPIYKYEVQPISGYTFTFIRKGNMVDVQFYGVCARNQGYQDLNITIPQGFRPVQRTKVWFDNISGLSVNGSGSWELRADGSISSFSTTPNNAEKMAHTSYLTNDPELSDIYKVK